MKQPTASHCRLLSLVLMAALSLGTLGTHSARAQEPIKPAPPAMTPDTKAERLRLIETEMARIQGETGTIRSAVGWTFMGIGAGMTILGTLGTYVFLDSVSSAVDGDDTEPSSAQKAENVGYALLFGVLSGSVFLVPGILTYTISTDDEDLPENHFIPRSQYEGTEGQLDRAERTLQHMADSARYRRLAMAWSFAGVGAATAIGTVAWGLATGADPSVTYQAAGYSALLYGGLATWQFLTTWDSEDTWAAFQNNELPQLESSHFQWALSPSVTPDGNMLLSFALVH